MEKREIKFRAWDKFDSKMITPNDGDFIGWHAMSNWKDCLVVMQFTGLTDKNGKEIYEFDIVKYTNPYSKKTYTHICLWDFRFACFGLFEKNNEWCKESDWMRIIEVEVLGNIYETPELLK